jgi:ribosomal protein S26
MLFLSFTSKSHTACPARFTRMVCLSFCHNVHLILILDDDVVVRVRSREGRRNRAPPPRVRWKDGKKVNPAVAAAEDAKAAAGGTAGKA